MEQLLSAFAEPILRALPRIPQAVLALLIGIIVVHLLQWFFEKALRIAKTPRSLYSILTSISQVVLWIILIAVIFQSLGLGQVALALSGSLAIVGVAVGAGANSLVQDIIAGLFLARDSDFDVGFQVKTGDIEGTIRRLDIRKVRIEDKDGRIHVLPNSSLDKASWVVIKRDEK